MFDPERFLEDNKAKRHPLAFMPFGQVPMICVGMRLTYFEIKTALAQVLRKREEELNVPTVSRKLRDMEIDNNSFPVNYS